jgi:hypothetical protein
MGSGARALCVYNHVVIVVVISLNFWHCLLGKLQAIRFLDKLATLDWQGLVKNNIFECFVFLGNAVRKPEDTRMRRKI